MQRIRFRHFYPSVFLLLVLLLMLWKSPSVIEGAHTGLELWYEAVLPSILPFMIITSLLLQQLQGRFICFTGLMCGLPIGANLINLQFCQNVWTKEQANALLCICNITSPMFILGYILQHSLQNQVPFFPFLLAVYLPICIYCLLKIRLLSSPQTRTFTEAANINPDSSTDTILKHSLQAILIIGVIIMIFCIIMEFILPFIPASACLPRILVACLEITNGIHLLSGLSIPLQQKTALIAGLTSFGGICSILQTKHVITSKELSVLHYTFIKLCMGISSYLLVHLFYALNLFSK